MKKKNVLRHHRDSLFEVSVRPVRTLENTVKLLVSIWISVNLDFKLNFIVRLFNIHFYIFNKQFCNFVYVIFWNSTSDEA